LSLFKIKKKVKQLKEKNSNSRKCTWKMIRKGMKL